MPKLRVFLRKFGSLAGLLRQNQNFPCPHFSAGERKLKYPGPGFWTQPGIRGSNRTHLFFVLLRASVPPWCKGLVFGLRLRRAVSSWRRGEAFAFQYFTIAANDAASRLAPPTRAPSISSCSISSLALLGFTLPP